MISKGEFRNAFKTVRAILGGSLYSSADTVCYLLTGEKPEGGVLVGNVSLASQQATVSGVQPVPSPLEFHPEDISKQASYFRGLLAQKNDTTLPSAPLDVQTSQQCFGIPEVVNGPLFLNSPMAAIVWKEKRRIYVEGDVQITGNAAVENVDFVCDGDFKCLDQCALRNVSVFTTKHLVIGDRSCFSGNALVLSSVLVYRNARIENKSVIVAYGETSVQLQDSAQRKNPQLPISIFLRDNASVDGVIVACGTPGGIETDRNTLVNGALWASGTIVHQGSLYGILRANQLTDMGTMTASKQQTPGMPLAVAKNTLTGSIHPLQTIASYSWPFFMGKAVISRWDEG